jgi:hypothetical protein
MLLTADCRCGRPHFLDDGPERPFVLAWMPAVSLYFSDPDGHSLEFIGMLPDPPKPELGIVARADWEAMQGRLCLRSQSQPVEPEAARGEKKGGAEQNLTEEQQLDHVVTGPRQEERADLRAEEIDHPAAGQYPGQLQPAFAQEEPAADHQ